MRVIDTSGDAVGLILIAASAWPPLEPSTSFQRGSYAWRRWW